MQKRTEQNRTPLAHRRNPVHITEALPQVLADAERGKSSRRYGSGLLRLIQRRVRQAGAVPGLRAVRAHPVFRDLAVASPVVGITRREEGGGQSLTSEGLGP